jgi:hypothetical protein
MLKTKDFTIKDIKIASYTVSYCLFQGVKKYPWNSINNPYPYLNTNFNKYAEIEDDIKKVLNVACFSKLGYFLDEERNKDYNRIIYIFNKHKALSNEECLRWLLLAKQNKFLPRYTNINNVLQNSNVVFDYSKITFNLLYVYLTIIRMLVEEPKYIKNVLVLVDNYKINYFAAIIAAKYYGFNNFGHSFCNPNGTYPTVNEPSELNKLCLNSILGLYRFIQQNCPDVERNSRNFSAVNQIKKMSSTNMKLDINELINLDMEDVLQASTDKEAEILLNNKLL